jgi:uncharacterized protein (TIGR02145 family)
MKFRRTSLRLLATFAIGLFVLVACQNATESSSSSGPVVASATYTMGSATRVPDSIRWNAPKDSGSQKQNCDKSTLVCMDTFHLSEPLGQDSLSIQLWTLGIRTLTIYFGQPDGSSILELKASRVWDVMDTLLLSKYYALTTDQKASFSALGQGASSLVAYYASLLLAGDTTFVGKSLPVGMSADSVKKDLVYLAGKQGWTVDQLLAKNLLSGLDSATVLQDVNLLIQAGTLNSTDSASIFPPYPVRVKTAVTVNGTLTAGGSAVFVSGAFVWTKGQNIKAPAIQVRTSKLGDSAYFTTPTKQFTSTDTIWNMDRNLSIQASSSASAGTDTLVVTISDDAGHSATSRTAFQVVGAKAPADSIAPKIQRVNPSQDTSVAWATKSVLLSWTVTDDSSLAKVTLNDSTLVSVGGSSLYQKTAALGVGTNTFVLLALDAHGNPTRDTIRVSRLADTSKPTFVRGSTAKDVVLLKSVATYAPSWTVADNAIQSVTINGIVVTAGNANTYSTPVTLSGDSLWITLVATDSAGNTIRDSIQVRRLAPPTISPNGAALSGSQTTTAAITANLPGATIFYSTNRADWNAFSTTLSISTSQILYAKATLGGVTSEVDSAVFLYAPSLPASGPTASGQTITITAPGAAIEDSLSTGGGWTSYANPVQLNASTKVYARSRLGAVVSSTVSGIYVLPPVLSPNPVAASYADTITVKASDPGADSLQWSTDNSIWTTGFNHQFTASGTFYAKSSLGGITSSTASEAIVVKHDTTLKALTVSGTSVTISGTTLTMDSLPGLTTQVTIVATPNDPYAKVSINGGTSDTVTLSNDSATVTVLVSSGSSTLTYTLVLNGKHSGTFTDARDGQTYNAVKIGSQWWMAQNLNYSVDRSWCYENSTDSCAKYGRSYDWSAAMGVSAAYDSTLLNASLPYKGVCPSGWHVPSDDEWTKLTDTILSPSTAGTVLKSTSGWSSSGNGTDSYGFRVLPAGSPDGDGSFDGVGSYALFCSATEFDGGATWTRYFGRGYASVNRNSGDKSYGLSVRCLEN